MDIVNEFFSEANFLATVVMILVVLYWLLMIVGVVGMDTFDVDVDIDADVGLDVDPGIDIGADVDLETGIDLEAAPEGQLVDAGGADFDTSGGSTSSSPSGFMRSIFDFFYLSDVPIVIVASTLVGGYWVTSVVLNHFFNPELTFNGSLIWSIPSMIVAVGLTRLAVMPIAAIARKSKPEDRTRKSMVGLVGRVTTSEVTETFGQMEVKIPHEPELRINIRIAKGPSLGKGDAAKIISYNYVNDTYLVELTKWENNFDD
ncbi:MAG: hypothetical protein AAFN77_00030 [Planctomycetota bacterium]